MRTEAKNDFEKDFFKLMNNSVFGKTMENIRNRVNIQIGTDENYERLVKKVSFKDRMILDEHMTLVHLQRLRMKMNKPIYVGQAILDISKTIMYNFHLDYAKKKWGENLKLLFTDTDSLCYEIKTEDVYDDIREDVPKMFDTSAYPKGNLMGFPRLNKKVIGLMKDETNGNQILEFIGLRSKLYSYKVEKCMAQFLKDIKDFRDKERRRPSLAEFLKMIRDKNEKKAKGIGKTTIKKELTIEDYRECLLTKTSKDINNMRVIRSHKHTLYSEEIRKTALDCKDDKRIILADGISTRAIGHYLEKE